MYAQQALLPAKQSHHWPIWSTNVREFSHKSISQCWGRGYCRAVLQDLEQFTHSVQEAGRVSSNGLCDFNTSFTERTCGGFGRRLTLTYVKKIIPFSAHASAPATSCECRHDHLYLRSSLTFCRHENCMRENGTLSHSVCGDRTGALQVDATSNVTLIHSKHRLLEPSTNTTGRCTVALFNGGELVNHMQLWWNVT